MGNQSSSPIPDPGDKTPLWLPCAPLPCRRSPHVGSEGEQGHEQETETPLAKIRKMSMPEQLKQKQKQAIPAPQPWRQSVLRRKTEDLSAQHQPFEALAWLAQVALRARGRATSELQMPDDETIPEELESDGSCLSEGRNAKPGSAPAGFLDEPHTTGAIGGHPHGVQTFGLAAGSQSPSITMRRRVKKVQQARRELFLCTKAEVVCRKRRVARASTMIEQSEDGSVPCCESCHNRLYKGKPVAPAPCGHKYHQECVEDLQFCPICNESLECSSSLSAAL